MVQVARRRNGGMRQARRVLITLPRANSWPERAAAWREWSRHPVALHPVVRLTADGPDFGVWPGEGDEVGYGMFPYPDRGDDCFPAAVATALQVPIEQVPDLRIDARIAAGEDPVTVSRSSWLRIDRWARELGFVLTIHDEVPVARDRWVGVCPDPAGSWMLGDHCLVMSRERLLFDPSVSVVQPPGRTLVRFGPEQVAYGISFEPRRA